MTQWLRLDDSFAYWSFHMTSLWHHYDARWLMLTLPMSSWLIPTRIICLFNTNILYEYINPSLPSLYSRLDFFHNHNIVSWTRQGTLGLFHWGLSLVSHWCGPSSFASHTQQNVDLQFVSPPLVLSVGLTWHFSHISLEHSSTWYLCIIILKSWYNFTPRTKHQNAHCTIMPVMALQVCTHAYLQHCTRHVWRWCIQQCHRR